MAFAYYNRLTHGQKSIYRKSDGVDEIRLPDPRPLQDLVVELATALKQQNRPRTESACQKLTAGMTIRLHVPSVRVKVLTARPHSHWGELHGLYLPAERNQTARITVWMRTARRRQVVAFRTFLRTLLHEICHHLDYALLALDESFHTEGFYRRESSLFHQLVSLEKNGPDPAFSPVRDKRSMT